MLFFAFFFFVFCSGSVNHFGFFFRASFPTRMYGACIFYALVFFGVLSLFIPLGCFVSGRHCDLGLPAF